jgi:tripeptidyl-peptidase-1
MAVAQKSPTTFWSINQNSQDPFLDWILALDNTAYPPLVHSMSYGGIAREEDSKNALRFNAEACKLSLRGLTIVVSSGDDGVANFAARNNQSSCGFSPSFPATSPYVLAVGATQGPESGQPEVACTSATGGVVTTGGGFSIYFPRPSWQASQVSNYLNSAPNLPPVNLFSSNGRGYPDVAALGYNYNVVIAGQIYQVSGTSASAPVVAGMLSLINGARLAAGKPALGWINSRLYQLVASSNVIVNDITVGENNCCAGSPGSIVCCQYGFNATTGWDPLTGLGSLNFVGLKKAFLV